MPGTGTEARQLGGSTLPCELCGDRSPKRPYFARFGIVQCSHCHLVFFAGTVDLSSIYSARYFQGDEYLDYRADKEILQANFAERIRDLLRLSPPPGHLLEIGCAYGFFLELARQHWEVRGFDIAQDGIAHAREVLGLDVTLGEFLDAPDEPGSVDIVCLWETVEHLAHPVRVLEKAARWLRPSGVLALTTGDVGSLVARVRGDRWRLVHPPSHLFYFSRETLGRACRQAGLVVEQTRHVGYRRSYRSMAHGVLAKRSLGGFVERVITLGGKLDFPVGLNLFDIVLIVARKPL